MTAVSKNVCFDVLNNIVDKCNNMCYNTIKLKPVDVKFNSHAEYNVYSNAKDPKFKIGNHVTVIKIFLLKDLLLTGQKKLL